MRDYGVQVFRNGAVFHGDGRKRKRSILGHKYLAPHERRGHGARGVIRGFSRSSQKSLEFVAANIAGRFQSLLTLTYHGTEIGGEDAKDRNRRIARKSKRDLNRFLTCLRPEIGGYLWVQEFQERGVVHYHVLCEGTPSQERVAVAWCRATGELDDVAAMRHGAKAERIESEHAARVYLGRYLGKARQKVLPLGVDGAGRWWGRSRSLELVLLEEIISGEAKQARPIREGLQIHRCLRKYVSKVFKRKFRGGRFLDWGGELSQKLKSMIPRLVEEYGQPMTIEQKIALADRMLDLEPVEFKEPPREEVPLVQRRRQERLAAEQGCGMDAGNPGQGEW